MLKKLLPALALALVAVAGAFLLFRSKSGLRTHINEFYPLHERQGTAATWAEWNNTKVSADRLIRMVRENPGDKKSTLALASLYIQEGRASGNHDYYDKAALYYLDQVLQKEPSDFEALTMKALVQLSKHRFSDALKTASAAQHQNPYNAFVYGLLVDSYVELGQYSKAVESADQMVSIRPDMRSYARVAYLREIHGDLPGAIEAMKMAVDAGGEGDEPSSWTRVQLGKLYEQTGDLQRAALHYQITLDARPSYANAVAGLGRIAMIQKDYTKALSLFQQADSLPSDHGFGEEIAQAYLALGQKEKAMERLRQMEARLKAEEDRNKDIPDAAYHTDMELTAVYLLMEKYDAALAHALKEYNRRPANIELNEWVGWLYFKNGDSHKALAYAQEALRTGCKNPVLLARTGLIFAAAGQKLKGRQILQQSLAHQTLLDPQLQAAAEAAL